MAIAQIELENLLKASFPEAEIKIVDLAGDGDHYSLEICAPEFAGKSRIIQHKMVNEALAGILGGKLHALAIKTKTPN